MDSLTEIAATCIGIVGLALYPYDQHSKVEVETLLKDRLLDRETG